MKYEIFISRCVSRLNISDHRDVEYIMLILKLLDDDKDVGIVSHF